MAARGYSRRQVLANAAIAASRVGLVAVGRRSIFVVPERQVSTSRGFLPVPRVPSGCGRQRRSDPRCSQVSYPYGGRCRDDGCTKEKKKVRAPGRLVGRSNNPLEVIAFF